jgi:hypothetical protein
VRGDAQKGSFYLQGDFNNTFVFLLTPNERGAILNLKVHKRQPQKHSKQSRDVPAIHADSIYLGDGTIDMEICREHRDSSCANSHTGKEGSATETAAASKQRLLRALRNLERR